MILLEQVPGHRQFKRSRALNRGFEGNRSCAGWASSFWGRYSPIVSGRAHVLGGALIGNDLTWANPGMGDLSGGLFQAGAGSRSRFSVFIASLRTSTGGSALKAGSSICDSRQWPAVWRQGATDASIDLLRHDIAGARARSSGAAFLKAASSLVASLRRDVSSRSEGELC